MMSGRRRHNFFHIHAERFCHVAPRVVDFALAEDSLDVLARRRGDFAGNGDVVQLIAVLEQTFERADVNARTFGKFRVALLIVEIFDLVVRDAELIGDLRPIRAGPVGMPSAGGESFRAYRGPGLRPAP